MKLSPMQYRDYVWPHNPRVYSIDYQRELAIHKIPFGMYHVQDMGRSYRILKGEGEFIGEDAYEEFKRLATVFYAGGTGVLIHPIWMATQAYFVALRLEQAPRPDYVKYSFEFWEDSTRGVAAALDHVSGSTATGKIHVVAKGETLWGIANLYETTYTALLAKNPQIKNPNLIFVGDRVVVS